MKTSINIPQATICLLSRKTALIDNINDAVKIVTEK